MREQGCAQELCANWTGSGCICDVAGIDPKCGPCSVGVHERCAEFLEDAICCDGVVYDAAVPDA